MIAADPDAAGRTCTTRPLSSDPGGTLSAARTQQSQRALEQLSDVDLAAQCANGDERAWEVLVRRYRRLVYAIPCRAGLPPEEADDVFQLTFSRLFERLATLRDPARLRAWLVTTARRLTLDTATRRRGVDDSEAVLSRVADGSELPNEEFEQLEEQHLVRTALERLGERCRKLLQLLYYGQEERPAYQGVAEELGMPVGSIGPTRARCLQKLMQEYRRLVQE